MICSYIYYFLSNFDHIQLCGSVKSWKRAQDPSNGKPKGFGFCEFESAEGILRATRLLNKLSIDGQELVVCVVAYFLKTYWLAVRFPWLLGRT